MNESVIHFGPDLRLMGILSLPDPMKHPDSGDRPAFVFLNAGIIHHVGPNRIHVRLARTLADAGYRSFRFDLPGIGDSLPLDTRESVDEEHRQGVEEALDTLEAKGLSDRFVLFGLCSGAILGFQVASQDPRVMGLVFIDPPTMFRTFGYHLVRAVGVARRPRVWIRFLRGRYGVLNNLREQASMAFGRKGERGVRVSGGEMRARAREALKSMSKRDFRLLLIVTGSLAHLYNYRRQFFDLFPGIGLKRFARVEFLPLADHTFSGEASRKRLTLEVLDWSKVFSADSNVVR